MMNNQIQLTLIIKVVVSLNKMNLKLQIKV